MSCIQTFHKSERILTKKKLCLALCLFHVFTDPPFQFSLTSCIFMIFRLLSFIIHIPFVPPTTFSSQKRARRVLKDLAVDGIFICSWSWPFRQIYCVRAVPLRKTPNDYWEINSCFSDLKTFFFSIFVLSVFFSILSCICRITCRCLRVWASDSLFTKIERRWNQ